MSIREDLVQQGIRFLKHPKVQNTPISERLQFLEKKGLTVEEIAKVMKAVENTSGSSASVGNASLSNVTKSTALESAVRNVEIIIFILHF